jgi:hypothetical protein
MAEEDLAAEMAKYPDPHQDQDFDRNQLECLLSLTPEQRMQRHELWRQFVFALREARIQHYGYDPAIRLQGIKLTRKLDDDTE